MYLVKLWVGISILFICIMSVAIINNFLHFKPWTPIVRKLWAAAVTRTIAACPSLSIMLSSRSSAAVVIMLSWCHTFVMFWCCWFQKQHWNFVHRGIIYNIILWFKNWNLYSIWFDLAYISNIKKHYFCCWFVSSASNG